MKKIKGLLKYPIIFASVSSIAIYFIFSLLMQFESHWRFVLRRPGQDTILMLIVVLLVMVFFLAIVIPIGVKYSNMGFRHLILPGFFILWGMQVLLHPIIYGGIYVTRGFIFTHGVAYQAFWRSLVVLMFQFIIFIALWIIKSFKKRKLKAEKRIEGREFR